MRIAMPATAHSSMMLTCWWNSAQLVPVPLARLALILHLGDDFAGLITLLASSVYALKLSLAGKVSFVTPLESLALPGNEMALTQGILERDMHKLENNGIIMPEQVCSAIRILFGLVLGQQRRQGSPDRTFIFWIQDRGKKATLIVGLFKIENVRHRFPAAWSWQEEFKVPPACAWECCLNSVIQGKTINPIML